MLPLSPLVSNFLPLYPAGAPRTNLYSLAWSLSLDRSKIRQAVPAPPPPAPLEVPHGADPPPPPPLRNTAILSVFGVIVLII